MSLVRGLILMDRLAYDTERFRPQAAQARERVLRARGGVEELACSEAGAEDDAPKSAI